MYCSMVQVQEQGDQQWMRLQKRLYGIFLVRFLAFMTPVC